MALAAGDDGLDLVHRILAEAPRHLTPGRRAAVRDRPRPRAARSRLSRHGLSLARYRAKFGRSFLAVAKLPAVWRPERPRPSGSVRPRAVVQESGFARKTLTESASEVSLGVGPDFEPDAADARPRHRGRCRARGRCASARRRDRPCGQRPTTFSSGTSITVRFHQPTMRSALPAASRSTARTPSAAASRRSSAVGWAPRWTWPSTVARASAPVVSHQPVRQPLADAGVAARRALIAHRPPPRRPRPAPRCGRRGAGRRCA